MRTVGALLLCLSFIAAAHAADEEPEFESVEVQADGSTEDAAAETNEDTPEPILYEPEARPASAVLLETFQDGYDSWSLSTHGDAKSQKARLATNAPTGETGGYEGEKMLTFTSGGRFALARMLGAVAGEPSEISPGTEEKSLVLQYEIRAQQPVGCGGGYLKIAGVPAGSDDDEAADEAALTITPATDLSKPELYSVMFGPDKCGGNNKVHLIVRHRNPVTGEVSEHHMTQPANGKAVWSQAASSQLYQLVIRSDDSYRVSVNGETVQEGSMHDEGAFEPPFQPAETIPDPEDSKPEDWVDEAKIPDPEDSKPENWIDDATVPDPEAVKPEDWDDEEDGEWEAPLVANPDFQGEWEPKMIANPEYKGEWKPRNIPNPAHYNPEKGAVAGGIRATGVILEVIAHTDDLAFDNVYIGTDEAEADAFAQAEWKPRYEAQEAAIEAAKEAKRKAAEAASDKELDALLLDDSILSKVSWVAQKGLRIVQRNPLIAAIGGAVIVTVLAFLVVVCCGSTGDADRARGHSHAHGGHGHSHDAPQREKDEEEDDLVHERVPEGTSVGEDEEEEESGKDGIEAPSADAKAGAAAGEGEGEGDGDEEEEEEEEGRGKGK